MASELRVNTLKDAAGNNSIATSFVAGGSAKAFLVCSLSASNAVLKSLNSSSITDQGTGVVDQNFATSFSDANYLVLVQADGTLGDHTLGTSSATTISTTGAVRAYNVRRDNGSAVDEPKAGPIVWGDLA